MSAPPNKALDHSGRYRRQCTEFSTALGWDAGSVFAWWEQCTLMREHEQRWPRPLAEWMAMRDVRALFYKPGAAGD